MRACKTERFLDTHNRKPSDTANALKTEFELGVGDTAAIYSLNNVDYLPISLAVGQLGAMISRESPRSCTLL